ncbi:Acetyltransferase (GNAT) domain-containing protein [Flavobacterium gillisiae]|uniref:Acetyltransferase (GNAT) domain-containing protein n=1 Tax=Flavobacterium gillisiae TaxID=150146 RepID=A0A1H4EPQ5_9FLAO|nr:GNAT family N-acetyltransferase [Flavobacterium gillisiae]SEA87045.1 Acetyltransferase (GNAT) domain-containing protein [Flavobacterium gillisiae]
MEFKFVKNANVSSDDLVEIATIKQSQWNYPIEDQLEWIKSNILPNDIHVLMFENGNVVAYMNLVQVQVQVNSKESTFIGLGNVCAVEKGKGYGRILMIEVQEYIKAQNVPAILLCKKELINFYTKFDWRLIKNRKDSYIKNDEINFMIYNFSDYVDVLKYDGRIF